MIEVRSPQWLPRGENLTVFLAGGITDCPRWQDELIHVMRDDRVTLVNPRRTDWDMAKDKAEDQIRWEHDMFEAVDAISFWFAEETLQPIALLELGLWCRTMKPIIIATHPRYPRRLDVITQMSLYRPELQVGDSLSHNIDEIRSLLTHVGKRLP